jgi:hypothetical protein
MNVVMLAVMATQSIPLSIDAFYEKGRGKVLKFCEFEPLQ